VTRACLVLPSILPAPPGVQMLLSVKIVGCELFSCVCLYVDSLSCKFSSPGRTGRKTRLMLVNEVALGSVKVRELYAQLQLIMDLLARLVHLFVFAVFLHTYILGVCYGDLWTILFYRLICQVPIYHV